MTTPDKIFPSGRFVPVDESERLLNLALTVSVGGTLSYADVQREIGVDIQHQRSGLWSSVRKRLLRDHGYAFRAVKNVGFRRLDDAGKVDCARQHIVAAGEAAKRSIRVSRTVNPTALDAQQKTAHLTNVAVATAVFAETSMKALQARDCGQAPPRPVSIEDLVRIGTALR